MSTPASSLTNPDSVQIPPIRTNLNDPVVTNQTAKEWYLYWKKSGDQINTLNGMVTWGNSAARLDPSLAPDGALYIESDRGGIIYQNQGGTWHYIAGTMWATLNPDQRPVGLGPNDAGFEFRSIDTDPNYAPRQFLWSGSEWVETTMVLYGTHAARPAADSKTPPRTLYVETDRSGVIYQQEANAWHFLAGTMYGTISPDTRPTDLGTLDSGFTFRASDQGRVFIWSGTVWTEVTPVGGWANLTHPNVVTRVASAGVITEGGITDLSAANSGRVTITAAGNVGIATANPVCILDTAGTIRSTGATTPASGAGLEVLYTSNQGYIVAYNRTGGAYMPLLLGSSVTIAANGYLGLNINPAYLLHLATDSAAKPTTNTWTIYSDIRLKQNIRPLEGGLEIINRLEPIEAEYNGEAGTPADGRVVSLDPAKLREVLPHAVSSVPGTLEGEETDILTVNTHEILYHLVLAVQQLAKKS